jgi:hypothetical protein
MEKVYDLMNKSIKQLEEVSKKLHNHSEENMAINIIIDDTDVQSQIFVEIENDNGESLRIGEELTTEEGYRKIRINTADIINHIKI